MANELTLLTQSVVVEINNCKEFLTKLIEPINQGLLTVSIAEPVARKETTSIGGISGAHLLEITPESKVFKLSFVDFIAYAVTAETYAQFSVEQESEGGWFRIYSKSFFLDCISKTTWATSEFPGPLVHYQVNTLDHTIDIVTTKPPEIVRV